MNKTDLQSMIDNSHKNPDKWIIKLVLICVVLLFACSVHRSVWAGERGIIPEPQTFIKKKTSPLMIDSGWVILFDSSPPPHTYPSDSNPNIFCAAELQKGLLYLLGVEIFAQPLDTEHVPLKKILLGYPLTNSNFAAICDNRGINLFDLPYKKDDSRYYETYILDIIKNKDGTEEIIIAAAGPAGLYYGIKTLLQLIDPSGKIDPFRIVDFPDNKIRGVHLQFHHILSRKPMISGYCLSTNAIDLIVEEIKKLSDYKLNTIIFQSPTFHNIQSRDLPHLKRLFNECRKRFITPIPTIDSRVRRSLYKPRENDCSPVLRLENQEAVWIQDEPFYFNIKGLAEPKNQNISAISNGSFELDAGQNRLPNWNIGGLGQVNPWQLIKSKKGKHGKDEVKNGNYSICLKHKGNSFLSSAELVPHADDDERFLDIIPNSYYELTFWVRQVGKVKKGLRISVYQHDTTGKKIKMGTTFAKDISLSSKWQNIHLPIFTNEQCTKLRLEFKAAPIKGLQPVEIYLDDIKLIRMNGLLVNLLSTPEMDVTIKSLNGKRIYHEGTDYFLTVGPYALEPPYNFEKLRGAEIRLTPNSAIRPNETVLVSYNCAIFNPRGEEARRCPSNPGTYEEYLTLFKKIIQLEPLFIHISLDEYRGGYNRDSRCLNRNMSNAEIFASFVNSLNRMIHSNNPVQVLPGYQVEGLGRPDIRLIMWDDMVNYWHNGGQERGEYYQNRYGGRAGSTYLAMVDTPLPNDAFFQPFPKNFAPISNDIIMVTWWYREDKFHIIKNSPAFLEERNFEYMVCTWNNKANIIEWAKAVDERKSMGMIATTWGGKKDGIPYVADYSWKRIGKRH